MEELRGGFVFVLQHDGQPYCHKPCYAVLFGPKGMQSERAAGAELQGALVPGTAPRTMVQTNMFPQKICKMLPNSEL